jgi:hypothetical protein
MGCRKSTCGSEYHSPRCLTNPISTDQGQWQQLREFGTPQTQAELDKNLVQLRDRLLYQ